MRTTRSFDRRDLGKDGLNLIPERLVYDRRVLSRISISFVGDLAAIDAVLQHEIEGAAGELLAAIRSAVGQDALLAPDPLF